jgi:Protein of unknown function (DUF2934)
MAKSKTPGSKTSRANSNNVNKEQNSAVNPASVPATEVTVVAAGSTPAEVVAAEVKPIPEPRKLEMVKTEPRKNVVVPIKMEDEVRRRAYEIFVERGGKPGNQAEDWLAAEREVRQRYQKQHSA